MMRRLFLKGKVWTVIVTLSVVMQASGQALIVNSNELPVDRQQYEHPKQIPLTDFFRNPSKTSFKISPDGLNIAFLTPHEGRMNVAIRSTDGSDERIMTNFTDRDVDSFEWGNDNTIICLKDNGGDKNFVLYVIDVQGKYIAITPAGSHTMIVDLLQHDDEHILFQSNLNNAEVFDLYKLNLSKKNFELFMENPGNITNWFVDSKGLPRLASATDGVGTTLMKFDGNSKWTPILTTSYRESVIPLFFDSDNKNVFCSSNVGRDKRAIVSFDIELGKETEIIYEHPEVDVNVLHQWQTKEFAGAGRMGEPLGVVEYETDKLNRHFFEDALVGLYANISAKLPDNYLFKVVSKDKQEKNLIIHAYSDKSPGAYYLYKVESVELLLLGELAPWINPALMADMEPLTLTSRHGYQLHGYLTLPIDLKKNVPIVVIPHAGPWTRDSWGYNSEVQFLASRGYGVLQFNFSGSVGYGRAFWEQGFKQWGQKMQDDISDGVLYLKQGNIAERNRVAIYGCSYGGYAALAGLAFTPELYTCGIDYSGISNLFTFVENIQANWQPNKEMLYEMVGDPIMDSTMMKKFSPAFQTDQINSPILIVQGAKHPRVRKSESDQMVKALEKGNGSVVYLVEPEEGDGWHNEENRFKFYAVMENFLAQHLNNGWKHDPNALKK